MTYRPIADNTPAGVSPNSPAGARPYPYMPRVARYARGPWIEPVTIIPSEFRWRNARTHVAIDRDGLSWRVLLVTQKTGPVGWLAVELLGTPLPVFVDGPREAPAGPIGLLVELSDGRIIRLPPGSMEVSE